MQRIVEFLLYDGLTSLDLVGPLEVFTAATRLLAQAGRPDQGYQALFAGLAPGLVGTSGGLPMAASQVLGGGPAPHTLLVPGGPGAEDFGDDPARLALVRAAARRAQRVVSVCTGAFILAACGLLDGRRATTHWLYAERFRQRFPRVDLQPDAIYVRDGHLATSAGVSAGIDLALALVEEDHGAQLALEVARLLVLYRWRPGSQSQFSSPLKAQSLASARFRQLHAWMLGHLAEDLPVERLASQSNLSPRHFARAFRRETGMTPGQYLETLRLDHARELLESGADSLKAVAQAAGFGREERLRRTFLRRLGVGPSQYRAHFKG